MVASLSYTSCTQRAADPGAKRVLGEEQTPKAPPSISTPSQINSDPPAMAELHKSARIAMAQKPASTYSPISSYTLASSASN